MIRYTIYNHVLQRTLDISRKTSPGSGFVISEITLGIAGASYPSAFSLDINKDREFENFIDYVTPQDNYITIYLNDQIVYIGIVKSFDENRSRVRCKTMSILADFFKEKISNINITDYPSKIIEALFLVYLAPSTSDFRRGFIDTTNTSNNSFADTLGWEEDNDFKVNVYIDKNDEDEDGGVEIGQILQEMFVSCGILLYTKSGILRTIRLDESLNGAECLGKISDYNIYNDRNNQFSSIEFTVRAIEEYIGSQDEVPNRNIRAVNSVRNVLPHLKIGTQDYLQVGSVRTGFSVHSYFGTNNLASGSPSEKTAYINNLLANANVYSVVTINPGAVVRGNSNGIFGFSSVLTDFVSSDYNPVTDGLELVRTIINGPKTQQFINLRKNILSATLNFLLKTRGTRKYNLFSNQQFFESRTQQLAGPKAAPNIDPIKALQMKCMGAVYNEVIAGRFVVSNLERLTQKQITLLRNVGPIWLSGSGGDISSLSAGNSSFNPFLFNDYIFDDVKKDILTRFFLTGQISSVSGVHVGFSTPLMSKWINVSTGATLDLSGGTLLGGGLADYKEPNALFSFQLTADLPLFMSFLSISYEMSRQDRRLANSLTNLIFAKNTNRPVLTFKRAMSNVRFNDKEYDVLSDGTVGGSDQTFPVGDDFKYELDTSTEILGYEDDLDNSSSTKFVATTTNRYPLSSSATEGRSILSIIPQNRLESKGEAVRVNSQALCATLANRMFSVFGKLRRTIAFKIQVTEDTIIIPVLSKIQIQIDDSTLICIVLDKTVQPNEINLKCLILQESQLSDVSLRVSNSTGRVILKPRQYGQSTSIEYRFDDDESQFVTFSSEHEIDNLEGRDFSYRYQVNATTYSKWFYIPFNSDKNETGAIFYG